MICTLFEWNYDSNLFSWCSKSSWYFLWEINPSNSFPKSFNLVWTATSHSSKYKLSWLKELCLPESTTEHLKKKFKETEKKIKTQFGNLHYRLSTSWSAGLYAFAPCNVPSEILLATYHTSKHWQSFRAQVNHLLLLLHQILPDSCSRAHSSLNHSITTSRWFSYIQLYINLVFPVTEKIHHGNNCKGHNLCLCCFVGTISHIKLKFIISLNIQKAKSKNLREKN